MPPRHPSKLDRALAQVCRHCPACRRARRKPTGMASRLVRRVEEHLCPFCRAYERVLGRKAHEGHPDARLKGTA